MGFVEHLWSEGGYGASEDATEGAKDAEGAK